MTQKYYSIREMSEKYGVAIQTIKSWIYVDKKLKAIKIGGAVRISEEAMQEIITPLNTKQE